MNYFPRNDDRIIAAALIDAIETGLPRDAIEDVLRRFHCVYASQREPFYEVIRSFIGDAKYSSFCNVTYLSLLVIVQTPSGVVLRGTPKANGERVGAVRQGAFMEVISNHGDWLEVDTKHCGRSFVHLRLVESY